MSNTTQDFLDATNPAVASQPDYCHANPLERESTQEPGIAVLEQEVAADPTRAFKRTWEIVEQRGFTGPGPARDVY